MAKRKPSPRSERREKERALAKLGRDRERLFQLEPGGSPERPIDIDSPSVVELKAEATPCPRCNTPLRVEAHRAPRSPGMRLREAATLCPRCGARRSIWFRLVGPSLN